MGGIVPSSAPRAVVGRWRGAGAGGDLGSGAPVTVPLEGLDGEHAVYRPEWQG